MSCVSLKGEKGKLYAQGGQEQVSENLEINVYPAGKEKFSLKMKTTEATKPLEIMIYDQEKKEYVRTGVENC